MLASVLILVFSVVLLVYWFRYSCLLLMRSELETPAQNEAPGALAGFRERVALEPALDPLERALDRDYQVLTYLLDHAAGIEVEAVERRILVLDYRLMRLVYRFTHTLAPQQARRALLEMADVVAVLGRKAGTQNLSRAEV